MSAIIGVHDRKGETVAELNVDPVDILKSADTYSDLASRGREISKQAADEVQRIADTHGPMGFPVAAGIAAGVANAEAPLNAKLADFEAYSQRFAEHAATYTTQDHEAAQQYDAP
jgi:hypothetical protein